MIKAVSFDLDDTLWPLMPTILNAEKVTNTWVKENYPGVTSLLNKKDVFAIRDKLVKNNPNLVNQLSELRKLSFIELGLLAGYSEQESRSLSKASFEIFFNARNDIELYEGVEETLSSLKSKYKLGVITNGNADLKKIGIDHYFDFAFSSSDLNASKPDPIMFQAAVDATSCSAEEICHVGDHQIYDVKASKDFGMHPIWFNEVGGEWNLDEEYPLEIKSWTEMESSINSF